MTKTVRRLGRGLSSLIAPEIAAPPDTTTDHPPQPESHPHDVLRGLTPSPRFAALPIDRIRQNPMQPRRTFDERTIQELASSLRARGALQPVVVRPAEGAYELVAGERRLRAARLAGMAEIPAIIRSVPDDQLLELALIENIHREDLNPIERAKAYRTLQQTHGLSHEEIADRVGEDRATTTNYIRLLSLPESVQELVASGRLSSGHAKAILGVAEPRSQEGLANRVVRENWSVRRLEAAVAAGKKERAEPAPERRTRPAVADVEQRLSAALGTRVRIHEGRRRHSGRVVIEYFTLDDFQRITERLGVTQEAM
jgi:ParB family transcriptional regulator, chromosome partitioning protein